MNRTEVRSKYLEKPLLFSEALVLLPDIGGAVEPRTLSSNRFVYFAPKTEVFSVSKNLVPQLTNMLSSVYDARTGLVVCSTLPAISVPVEPEGSLFDISSGKGESVDLTEQEIYRNAILAEVRYDRIYSLSYFNSGEDSDNGYYILITPSPRSDLALNNVPFVFEDEKSTIEFLASQVGMENEVAKRLVHSSKVLDDQFGNLSMILKMDHENEMVYVLALRSNLTGEIWTYFFDENNRLARQSYASMESFMGGFPWYRGIFEEGNAYTLEWVTASEPDEFDYFSPVHSITQADFVLLVNSERVREMSEEEFGGEGPRPSLLYLKQRVIYLRHV